VKVALGIGGVGVFIYVFIYPLRKFIKRSESIVVLYNTIEDILNSNQSLEEEVTPTLIQENGQIECNAIAIQVGPYILVVNKGMKAYEVIKLYLEMVEEALQWKEDILWNTVESIYYKELLENLRADLREKLWKNV